MAALMTIEEAVEMLKQMSLGEEFEFELSSVDFPCEVSAALVVAKALLPFTGGKVIKFARGCSTCAEHNNNPINHLVKGKKMFSPRREGDGYGRE